MISGQFRTLAMQCNGEVGVIRVETVKKWSTLENRLVSSLIANPVDSSSIFTFPSSVRPLSHP